MQAQVIVSEANNKKVDYQFVGGNHGTIDREPYVRILAAKLRAAIDEQLATSDGES